MNEEDKKRYQRYIETSERNLKTAVKEKDKTYESYLKKKIAYYKKKLEVLLSKKWTRDRGKVRGM